MDIRDVLKEMREKADARAEWGIPWEASELRSWADAFEAAMREPVAETWQAVIDRIAPAMEILSDHDEELHPAEAALALDRSRIRRELAPELVRIAEQLTDVAGEIEKLKEENEKYRLGMQENCQLRAEIERLKEVIDRAALNTEDKP